MRPINPRGTWTLFLREIRRFLKVKMQTIFTPALTAMLYLVIFRYAMGDRHVPGLEVDYFTFLVPGLAMMAMMPTIIHRHVPMALMSGQSQQQTATTECLPGLITAIRRLILLRLA